MGESDAAVTREPGFPDPERPGLLDCSLDAAGLVPRGGLAVAGANTG